MPPRQEGRHRPRQHRSSATARRRSGRQGERLWRQEERHSLRQQWQRSLEGPALVVSLLLALGCLALLFATLALLGKTLHSPSNVGTQGPRPPEPLSTGRSRSASTVPRPARPELLLEQRLASMGVDPGWFRTLLNSPGGGGPAAAGRWLVQLEQFSAQQRWELGEPTAPQWNALRDQLAANGIQPRGFGWLVDRLAQRRFPQLKLSGLTPDPQRALWIALAKQQLGALNRAGLNGLLTDAATPAQLRGALGAGSALLVSLEPVPPGSLLLLRGDADLRWLLLAEDRLLTQHPLGPDESISLDPQPDGEVEPMQLFLLNQGLASGRYHLSLQSP